MTAPISSREFFAPHETIASCVNFIFILHVSIAERHDDICLTFYVTFVFELEFDAECARATLRIHDSDNLNVDVSAP